MDTFTTLCEDTANNLERDPTILYELKHSSVGWIKDIIVKYNRLGFLTWTSQPGESCKNEMYKSEYHRRKEPTEENILYREFVVRKQRAYVRGYMDSDMADFVFHKLCNDPNLFVRTANNNIEATFECRYGSVNFYKDVPVATKGYEWETFEDLKNCPDAHWSFNFNLPLRFPFSRTLSEKYPNINHTNIIEVEILDLRWDNNSYLWTLLLSVIEKYYQEK